MQYTVADYNVTIKRGFVREDGKVLWGKNPLLAGGLEWRTQKAFSTAVNKKRKSNKATYILQKNKLSDLKLECGCAICGFGKHKYPKKYRKHIAMLLEFDHIDPTTKLYNVCDISHYSWDVIQTEIDKCRVLCKPCHTEHTGNQNRKRKHKL